MIEFSRIILVNLVQERKPHNVLTKINRGNKNQDRKSSFQMFQDNALVDFVADFLGAIYYSIFRFYRTILDFISSTGGITFSTDCF